MSLSRVHQAIDRDFAGHLARIQEFLRIPSRAVDEELERAAHWVADAIRGLGGVVELAGPSRSPVVFGRLDGGKPRTLLIYGMYDVQPTDGAGWSSPPFAAEVVERPGVGRCVIARGACNSKGPLAAFLCT